jgi:site-specific DNA-methyltransferase (adenine-specific)
MLMLGDCLERMKEIPDESVQLILTDLPFEFLAQKWDCVIPFEPLWKQYNRVLKKDGTVALFAAQPFTTALINSNIKDFRYVWYWIKNQGTNFFHAKRMPIRKVEEICIFGKGIYNPQISDGHQPTQSARGCSNGRAYHGDNKRDYEGGKTTRYPTNILEFKCVDNYSRIHVSQKPVDLLEYLIKTYTNEGDMVLDSCMGSGSSIVAAINTNRNYIGIERDSEIFNQASNRINNHKKVLNFDGVF